MIIVSHLSKTYGNITALNDVTMHIAKGEFAFLVGPSGAGKSTLIKLLHCEERPDSGTIMVEGRNLGRMPRRDIPRLRRRVGVVFQNFKLLDKKSVYENVAFALEVTGSPAGYIKRRAPRVLEMVALAGKEKKMPRQLSGGEQQRVALARAIVHSPPIVLADEPTGNLDRGISWELMQLLKKLNSRGLTVLVATHDWPIVDAMGNRVLELSQGRLVRDQAQGGYSADVAPSRAVSH